MKKSQNQDLALSQYVACFADVNGALPFLVLKSEGPRDLVFELVDVEVLNPGLDELKPCNLNHFVQLSVVYCLVSDVPND